MPSDPAKNTTRKEWSYTRVHCIGHICSVSLVSSLSIAIFFSPRKGLSSCKVPGKCCSKNPVRWLARSSKSHHWANVSEETEPARQCHSIHLQFMTCRLFICHLVGTYWPYCTECNIHSIPLNTSGRRRKLTNWSLESLQITSMILWAATYTNQLLTSWCSCPTRLRMMAYDGHTRIQQHLCLRDLDCRKPQKWWHALSELPVQPDALHIPVFTVPGASDSLWFISSLRVFVCQVFVSAPKVQGILLRSLHESAMPVLKRCSNWS